MDQLVEDKIAAIERGELAPNSQMRNYIRVLQKYAQGCEHITEMGVAVVCSSWAFLSAKPKRMVSVDIDEKCPVQEIEQVAKQMGINYEFIVGDTNHGVTATLGGLTPFNSNYTHNGKPVPHYTSEKTDLLFIDTYHRYESLKKELELHADKAKKYIILHDTISFTPGKHPQSQCGEGGDMKGLLPAVEEFLAANPHWVTEHHYDDWPGLYIMKRIG